MRYCLRRGRSEITTELILISVCASLTAVLVVVCVILLAKRSKDAARLCELRAEISSLKEQSSANDAGLKNELALLMAGQNAAISGSLDGRLGELSGSMGEMKQLSGMVVTELDRFNRLMSNVKSRGTWAELRLEELLEDYLPGMYEKNYHPATGGVVEFAVKLPDADGGFAMLPIDCKFPAEDWLRLCGARESGEADAEQAACSALRRRFIMQAREISKYISPPQTAPYAVMYLATEGLYGEAVLMDGLTHELMRDCGVIVAGPSVLAAVLDTVALSFRNVAAAQHGEELMKKLAAVEREQERFDGDLIKLRDSLERSLRQVNAVITDSGALRKSLSQD
ncbi:MAG: DNA recombination protein RmuC [Clostridia bacterium]|nr:DNA recombination protein RmuC [Clostridia bacterium]